MKIGFLSLPLTGHLNPMTALARSLQSRGNEVVFIGPPDIEPIVRAANLAFVPYCEREYPIGSLAKTFGQVAHLQGLEVVRFTVEKIMPDLLEAAFCHLPETLIETGIQAMVIDNAHLLAQLVPMSLNMPFVQICNALHRDPSGQTPPCWFSWRHEATPEARARNADGLKQINSLLSGILPMARTYAEKLGLKVDWNDLSSTSSKLAVITQAPAEFDFPGIPWPAGFHYAGPFHDNEGREPVPFPWEKLTGQPLIYASMGTLVNGLDHVYTAILEAVSEFPKMQVVLSVGRNFNPDYLGPIPANTIVVRTAPQIELLKRAALCITHAGLNTTLEALAQGVPLVAIPIGYDQPGVAARIAYHEVGEFVEIDNLTATRLSKLIARVTTEPNYRDKAGWFKKILAETRGLEIAADIIERVFGGHSEALALKSEELRHLREGAMPSLESPANAVSEFTRRL
jgi:zeaxanthin glucosyltransferase